MNEEKFVAFMEKLPELTEQKDAALSVDQLKACFRRLDSKGGGVVSEELRLCCLGVRSGGA